MKRFVLACVVALGLAGCGDTKASLEGAISTALENQMTVSEVNMTADASGNYTGYATGKTKEGLAAKRNCTASPDGSDFKWNCVPGIADETLRQVEATIRTGLSEKGDVKSVTLKKGADEDHMEGDASVEVDGEAVAAKCTAVREPLKTGTSFSWSCE